MDLALLCLVLGLIGGAVLGYWLATHIHSVANAATRAVTVPSAVLSAAPAPVAAALTAASDAAKTAVADTAAKVG